MPQGDNWRELQRLRQHPGYYDGRLIAAAGDVAMQVGRPPRRLVSASTLRQLGDGPVTAATTREEDYASIDQRYATDLTAQGAPGWVEEEG